MTAVVRTIGIVQSLAIAAVVLILLFPQARWSRRLRLPVALVALAASAAHLILSIV